MNIELIKKIVASAYSMGVRASENATVTSTDEAVAEWLASDDGKALIPASKTK